ncbi:MAG TPA: thioesterase domain-containing protein [Asanoa sp.]|nr:thioesterase domain-containing protein [Asanoa sp.]
MTAGVALSAIRWFVPPPGPGGRLLFCFPYAGVGASSYRQWPRRIDDVQVCGLQPPGRENRLRESPHRDHAAFAADLVDALTPYVDREFFFAGHCGGVPFALDTIDELARRGLPLPTRLIASSWGAPQRGLYGRLNFVDLAAVDLVAETTALFGRAGVPMRTDFAELAAQVLRTDLEVQRGYRFAAGRRVPCPVTVVAWTDDDVVPPEVVAPGWDECADVTAETLDGRHLDFLHCPDVLRDALRRWLIRE